MNPSICLDVLSASDDVVASIRGWTEVRWRHRADEVPSSGTFVLAPNVAYVSDDAATTAVREINEALRENPKVRLVVDGVTRGTGLVARRVSRIRRDSQGPTLCVDVSGMLWPALASVVPDGFSIRDKTVSAVVSDLLSQWGLDVVIDTEADRVATETRAVQRPVAWGRMSAEQQAAYLAEHTDLAAMMARPGAAEDAPDIVQYWRDNPRPTIAGLAETKESRDLHPHPDETIGAFLPRFLEGVGLCLMEGSDGSVILGTPDYTLREGRPVISCYVAGDGPIGEGTILEATWTESLDYASDIMVQGARRKVGRDVTRVASHLADESVSFRHRIYRRITDGSIRDQQEATRLAQTERNAELLGSDRYEAKVVGYAQGISTLRHNSMVTVWDEATGLTEDRYCVGIELSWSERGPETTLDLMLPGLWTV